MADSKENKYVIGIFISLIIGNVLYIMFNHWIFPATGLLGAILFLIISIVRRHLSKNP